MTWGIMEMMVPQWQGGAAIMYLMGPILQRHEWSLSPWKSILSNIPIGNRFPFKALVIKETTILNSFPVIRNFLVLSAYSRKLPEIWTQKTLNNTGHLTMLLGKWLLPVHFGQLVVFKLFRAQQIIVTGSTVGMGYSKQPGLVSK